MKFLKEKHKFLMPIDLGSKQSYRYGEDFNIPSLGWTSDTHVFRAPQRRVLREFHLSILFSNGFLHVLAWAMFSKSITLKRAFLWK